jgi:hypothetical protein
MSLTHQYGWLNADWIKNIPGAFSEQREKLDQLHKEESDIGRRASRASDGGDGGGGGDNKGESEDKGDELAELKVVGVE